MECVSQFIADFSHRREVCEIRSKIPFGQPIATCPILSYVPSKFDSLQPALEAYLGRHHRYLLVNMPKELP